MAANPTTTHVIEIETGIGEPAFIPLSMGQELQPISVGKKGMWRIESPRVLDVHAFVYFDGTSLFLQSADESNAASVDGYPVGKAWTELHAPCKIEIGTARLRFRSLLADADNQPTMMAPSPPVQAPPGGPGGARAGASIPAGGAPPPPQPGSAARSPSGGQPRVPSGMSAPPVAFPKAERPFKPGEFSSAPDLDESTRIAPLDSTGAGRVASGSHPRPAAGQPMEDPSTRPEAARMMRGATGANPVVAMGSGQMGGPMGAQGSGQFGAMGPGPMGPGPSQGMMGSQPGYPPQGYDPQQPQGGFDPQTGYPQQYPNVGGSGAYGAMGPGGVQQMPGPQGSMGPGMSGAYGSMTPQGMQQPGPPATPAQTFVAKLKANSIPKMIAAVLFLISAVLYLAEDDDAPVQPTMKKPVATLDGGPAGAGAVLGAGGSTGSAPTAPPIMPVNPPQQAWPAGVPCPPPNWPANTPPPCTPTATTSAAASGDKPPKDPKDPKDAGAHLPPGTKTLERQAVDQVAAGETAKAAASYEELMRRDPKNKVYAEAARILRAKLDGGIPQ